MSRPSKISAALAVAVAVVLGFANSALAAQDYSDLTDGFGAELTAALPVALTAVGLFIGVIMAYKIVRRVLRA